MLDLSSGPDRPSPEPGTPGKSSLWRTNTAGSSKSVGKGLARSTTNMDVDWRLGRTTTGVSPDVMRQTLGRTSTTNLGSAFLGRTLGRAVTGMGSMAFGNTLSRGGMMPDFGMTQPAVPPLTIDPLVTAMLQKASAQQPLTRPRATSPAFAVSGMPGLPPGSSVEPLCCAVLCCAALCCVQPCCAESAVLC